MKDMFCLINISSFGFVQYFSLANDKAHLSTQPKLDF